MGFYRQEYWSELPFPPPGDLPDLGVKPALPAFPASAGKLFTTEFPGKPCASGLSPNVGGGKQIPTVQFIIMFGNSLN